MMWIGIPIFIFMFYLNTMLASGIITLVYRRVDPDAQRSRVDCFCDYCGKVITPRWLANLPIINVIYLGGKTKCCDRPLVDYLQMEIALGMVITLVSISILKVI